MPNPQTGGKSQSKDEPPTVQKTLNGYDQALAQQMIANFALYYQADNNPKSVNAWYSIADLINIYNLLVSETQADGVRFYFGCDVPPAGTTTLNLTILLVSTQYRSVTSDTKSQHGDYYDHTAIYLNNGPFGLPVNHDAATCAGKGALMYGASLPGDTGCQHPGNHYLDTPTTYKWIQARCETSRTNDTSPLNTKAEWFQFSFIKSLFYSIINAPPALGFDGMRIYLGKGYNYQSLGILRDVVVLVPTKTDGNGNHVDHNGCVEDLLLTPFDGEFSLVNPSAAKGNVHGEAISRLRFTVHSKSSIDGGGYDNGELCPTYCN